MIAEIRPHRQDFFYLTGWDAALVPMLLVGCNGGTNATSGVVPELTRAIYQASMQGDWGRAMELQYRLLPLFDAMISTAEFPEGFRRGALVRGWDLGRSRQPLSVQQAAAADNAQSRLRELLAGFQLDPPRPSSLQRADGTVPADDVIESIVRQVLQQIAAKNQ
jgi:4-hydroxy-tetrahydrodipicolinate synthase